MGPPDASNDPTTGRTKALAACSRLPEARLTHPFGSGTAVFKVAARMFAAVCLDDEPGRVTLKSDPDFGSFLVQQFGEITPGYHMNKRHWITVILAASLPTDMVEDLIADSYDLVWGNAPGQGGRFGKVHDE
jgi:predicted DNA-binding protein (MmcQ/YjbR family)